MGRASTRRWFVGSFGRLQLVQRFSHTCQSMLRREIVGVDGWRRFIRRNLWGQAADGQDLKQVWFASVHSDVGGGYPDEESGEARAHGLLLGQARLQKAQREADYCPDPNGVLHESLTAAWWPELWPKRYWDSRAEPHGYRWKVPLGRRRHVGNDADIHPAVRQRQANPTASYKPANGPD